MDEGDQVAGKEEIEATIAMIGSHVLRAKIEMLVFKPLLYTLGFIAYCLVYSAALYGGTWIVVLALRHAKVLA